MAVVVPIASQNWLITPAVGVPAAAADSGQRPGDSSELWLVVLTGLCSVGFGGDGETLTWISETLRIVPDLHSPLSSVFGGPILAGQTLALNLKMWAPFAAVTGVEANNGFKLTGWRLTPFLPNQDRNFQGIDVDISVELPSIITEVAYSITMVGQISLLGKPERE
ncbi:MULTISPECIES: hypothetical protein [Mycobacterium]|uniref:Uncharacterized protein n=1 Tax=Mycobacterium kiyosense TaxID=2871094 RepID=A0A9P3QBX9_9MYCO|nr:MULTISPECIES: hypothetical protein [Mycobacterium]BDB40157.1 hypothetical protein IWGMT90018_06030 [Mycobacterium kiyosense]BDE11991.1 hypothetical protein MKCMC460_08510 [Mycobacterium sp. 20KCMC460]GLB85180.1 hypothetical protein SRL2020028_44360 [Mycobacterium kiyosense]GLB92525.1 hypothetical protein SRL2020130_53420 [Mycobacterium kiyosense]GLB99112.1 hypothetical protein SRL2020226_58880 [Mycobacterium kiyosense]